MNAALVTHNLLAWSGQILALIAMGALASMTLQHPRARLIFWQGLLVLCLLLPAAERWTPGPVDSTSSVSISLGPTSIVHSTTVARPRLWKQENLLDLIACGILLRFLWIGIGLFRLSRHRRQARPLAWPPGPIEVSRIRWYVSETVRGPVTFGWRRPCVLLPKEVMALPPRLLSAVACHELTHVQRNDWLQVMAEEVVRSLFWFHPAIWFALGELQLAREQVVDRAVVRVTSDREGYLEALLAVAAYRLQPDVVPASMFLKKRHLATRVAAVLKEVSMSKSGLYSRLTAVASAALVTAWIAGLVLPLQSPAQTATAGTAMADDPGIVVNAGGTLLHRPFIFYAGGTYPTGTVVLQLTVNSKGEVTNAQVISGPEELRSLAMGNALQWHYAADSANRTALEASITFGPAGSPRPLFRTISVAGPPRVLASIQFVSVPPALEQSVRSVLQVQQGGQFTPAEMMKTIESIRGVDEHLDAKLGATLLDGSAAWILTVSLAQPGSVAEAHPISSGAQRIRVGGNVQAGNLISKTTPAYPLDAKAARIQGKVRFTALIGTDGTVKNLEVVTGPELVAPPSSLIDTASAAVKQWVYQPVLLNGQPVEVLTQIDVNFTLAK